MLNYSTLMNRINGNEMTLKLSDTLQVRISELDTASRLSYNAALCVFDFEGKQKEYRFVDNISLAKAYYVYNAVNEYVNHYYPVTAKNIERNIDSTTYNKKSPEDIANYKDNSPMSKESEVDTTENDEKEEEITLKLKN